MTTVYDFTLDIILNYGLCYLEQQHSRLFANNNNNMIVVKSNGIKHSTSKQGVTRLTRARRVQFSDLFDNRVE